MGESIIFPCYILVLELHLFIHAVVSWQEHWSTYVLLTPLSDIQLDVTYSVKHKNVWDGYLCSTVLHFGESAWLMGTCWKVQYQGELRGQQASVGSAWQTYQRKFVPLLSTECLCDHFFTMFRGTLPVLYEDIHTSSNTKTSTLNVIKM